MRGASVAVVACAAIACCWLAACGGNSASMPDSGPGQPAPAELVRTLPPMPAGLASAPRRGISSANFTQLGDQSSLLSSNATTGPGFAQLSPGAGEVAYAMYQFTGAPSDALQELSYTAGGLAAGGKFYAAIANYTTARWDFYPAQASPAAVLPLAGDDYVSPGGSVYVLFAAWDGEGLTVETVSVELPGRHAVSGKVVDQTGAGLPGVLVSSTYGGQRAYTDASGNYSINGIPDGDWYFMCTKPGLTFFDQPALATIAGGDATLPDFLGAATGELWESGEAYEPNDHWFEAKDLAWGSEAEAAVSYIDDYEDFYRVSLPAAGWYWFELRNDDESIYFPYMQVWDANAPRQTVFESPGYLSGTTWCGVYAAAARDVVLEVGCNGGGGAYALSMFTANAPAAELQIELYNGLDSLYNAEVEVQDIARGRVAHLPFNNGGTTYLSGLPPHSFSVTPQDGVYSFIPPSGSADLAAGPATLVFGYGNSPFNNAHEANDTFATATPLGALPFAEAGQNAITVADYVDYFSCTPANGKHLRIRLTHGHQRPRETSYSPLAAYAYDNAQNYMLGYELKSDEGIETRTLAPCNGLTAYVSVDDDNNKRILPYDIEVEEFEPRMLTYRIEDQAGTPGGTEWAHVRVFSETFDWEKDLWFDINTGLTASIPCLEGERIHAELYRYGLRADRSTRTTVLGGSDATVTFVMEEDGLGDIIGADTLEPNDNDTLARTIVFDVPVEASISGSTDSNDYYKLNVVDVAAPIQLDIVTARPLARLSNDLFAQLYDGAMNLVGQFDVPQPGVGRLVLPNPGTATAYVRLGAFQCETPYTLTVTQPAAAYSLSYSFRENVAFTPIQTVYVRNNTTGRESYSDALGVVQLGLLPPGTYSVSVYYPNRSIVGQPDTFDVTVDNVNLNFDLLMQAEADDQREDDDTFMQAALMAPGTPYTGNVTQVANLDLTDYFKLDAQAGDTWRFDVSATRPFAALSAQVIDANQLDQLNYCTLNSTGPSGFVDFETTAAGTYYVRVFANYLGTDYSVTLNKTN